MNRDSPEGDGMSVTETQPAAPGPKLRWYQYTLRSLLLLMLAVSIVFSWLAVRWQRQREQHIARVVIACPGLSAPIVNRTVAIPYCCGAILISCERIVAVSSREKVEVYLVARGVDPDKFLNRVRAVPLPVDDLHSRSAIREATLLPRGASIPEAECKMVDTLQVILDPKKLSHLCIKFSSVHEALSSQGKIAPTKEGLRLMEDVLVERDFDQGKVRLGEIAEIKIVQEPSHVVWEFPTRPQANVEKQGGNL
jgi:hypothetical protein